MNQAAPHLRCVACDVAMEQARVAWVYRCPQCGFLASRLPHAIGAVDSAATLDEDNRERGLRELRLSSFKRILEELRAACGSSSGELLDVGSAHGWFLGLAQEAGFNATGLEPDERMFRRSVADGCRVYRGFFPEDVPKDARYDVITFNDVFEHLPDPVGAIHACARLLKPGGHLVINLPSNKGALYRTAELFERLGWSTPFDRLWQRGFVSPHISYFNPDQLSRLAARAGFSEARRFSLPTLEIRNLFARIRMDRRVSRLTSSLIVFGAVLASPLLAVAPPDITVQIFRKTR